MTASYIQDSDLNELLTKSGLVVVDYTASWCGPCRIISPYIDKLTEEYTGRAQVFKIDLDQNSDIMHKGDFVEKPKKLFLEERLEVAREEARAICSEKGPTSPECAAAWDVVEELQAETSHQRGEKQGKTSFQAYCEANPDADECRIYED